MYEGLPRVPIRPCLNNEVSGNLSWTSTPIPFHFSSATWIVPIEFEALIARMIPAGLAERILLA